MGEGPPAHIEILGVFTQPRACLEEMQRAIDVADRRLLFSCEPVSLAVS